MRSISKEKIVGLRNILSHEYAIKIGIPPLLTTLNNIVTDIENGKYDFLF